MELSGPRGQTAQPAESSISSDNPHDRLIVIAGDAEQQQEVVHGKSPFSYNGRRDGNPGTKTLSGGESSHPGRRSLMIHSVRGSYHADDPPEPLCSRRARRA